MIPVLPAGSASIILLCILAPDAAAKRPAAPEGGDPNDSRPIARPVSEDSKP